MWTCDLQLQLKTIHSLYAMMGWEKIQVISEIFFVRVFGYILFIRICMGFWFFGAFCVFICRQRCLYLLILSDNKDWLRGLFPQRIIHSSRVVNLILQNKFNPKPLFKCPTVSSNARNPTVNTGEVPKIPWALSNIPIFPGMVHKLSQPCHRLQQEFLEVPETYIPTQRNSLNVQP